MTEPKQMVFLTGFMGSGKSTIGPELAKQIGYDFTDMDSVIEKAEGMSVQDIFRRRGEEYFRRIEKQTLIDLAEGKTRSVVALGGGAVADESNRQLAKSKGVLVYLKVSPEIILERVGRGRSRPMLLDSEGNTLDDPELSAKVDSLLSAREAYYMEADIVVDTSGSTVMASAREIASKLEGLIK